MTITVTLHFASVAEATEVLSRLYAKPDTEAAPVETKKEGKPKATTPATSTSETVSSTASAPAPATPVVETAVAPGKSQSAPPAVEPSSAKPMADVDYKEVKDHILALAKISPLKAAEALKAFGVDHGTKLKPEQYADFITKAKEMGAVI